MENAGVPESKTFVDFEQKCDFEKEKGVII